MQIRAGSHSRTFQKPPLVQKCWKTATHREVHVNLKGCGLEIELFEEKKTSIRCLRLLNGRAWHGWETVWVTGRRLGPIALHTFTDAMDGIACQIDKGGDSDDEAYKREMACNADDKTSNNRCSLTRQGIQHCWSKTCRGEGDAGQDA